MAGRTAVGRGSVSRTQLEFSLQFPADSGTFSLSGNDAALTYVLNLGSASPTFSVDWTASSSIPASSATYYNSSGNRASAASGTARVEYNPSTLALAGLLLEEQRTNLFLQSGTWNTTNVVVTTSSTPGADGSTNMQQFAAGAAASANAYQGGYGVTSGANFALSVDLKKTNYNYVNVFVDTDAGDYWVGLVFDFSSGTVTQTATGATGGTLVSTSVKALANGIYRVSIVGNMPFANAYVLLGFAKAATGNTFSIFGSVNNASLAGTETFLCQCIQFENGNFPTSYIPTTTVSVTRSADIVSSTDATLLAAKAWVVEVGELPAATASTLLGVNTVIGLGETTGNTLTTADGGAQTTSDTGTWTGTNRGGVAWDAASRVSICLNGGTLTTATNTASTPTTLYFGNTNNGASGFLNGHIRTMASYSALNDNQLDYLTAVGQSFTIVDYGQANRYRPRYARTYLRR
jgi:hypothetical protein